MDVRLPDEVSEIKPGETSDLHIYLKNTGDDFASNLTALLTTSSPYLTINTDTAYYGQLYPEQYKYRPFNVTLNSNTPAGTTEAPITLTVTEKTGRTTELDAVFYFQNTGQPPQSCNPVENLSAEVIDSDIQLTWNVPSTGTPEKYTIYCNGEFLRETTDLTYTHANVKLGTYHYCVEALYGNGCTGEPACVEIITPCNLSVELKVQVLVGGHRLTWTPAVENVHYKVYRDSALLTEVEGNGYNDTNIQANTRYCYTIIAVCPDDTESEPSNEVCVGTVGIDELKNDIKIYPNPTTGELIVMSSEYRVESIEIFDVMGRCVGNVEPRLIASLRSEIGQSEIVLDISHLHAGMYFIRIQTENEKITKKIIIQK
jgi:hypothetical protein